MRSPNARAHQLGVAVLLYKRVCGVSVLVQYFVAEQHQLILHGGIMVSPDRFLQLRGAWEDTTGDDPCHAGCSWDFSPHSLSFRTSCRSNRVVQPSEALEDCKLIFSARHIHCKPTVCSLAKRNDKCWKASSSSVDFVRSKRKQKAGKRSS